MRPWEKESQTKRNKAWFLPRPKPDRYKGGMPLHCESWLLGMARDMLHNPMAEVLNLFCGMNQEGFRVDINPDVYPDLVCDAHELSKHIGDRKFDIILADPPFSDEEAEEIFGTPKLNYSKWTLEATKVLNEGGLFIIYHKCLVPNPDPEIYRFLRRVFIGTRVWHVGRIAVYFEKKITDLCKIFGD
jgi:hypothetical protein